MSTLWMMTVPLNYHINTVVIEYIQSYYISGPAVFKGGKVDAHKTQCG